VTSRGSVAASFSSCTVDPVYRVPDRKLPATESKRKSWYVRYTYVQ